jgi:hypothetical protein
MEAVAALALLLSCRGLDQRRQRSKVSFRVKFKATDLLQGLEKQSTSHQSSRKQRLKLYR